MDYHSVLNVILLISPAASIVLGILLAISMFVSFIMAGSEIAFFSLQHKDINLLKTRPQPSYKRVINLLDQPKSLRSTLIITSIFANIAVVLIANLLLGNVLQQTLLLPWAKMLIKIAAILLFIFLFAELLPKAWAANQKIIFASNASLVIELFHSLFFGLGRRLGRMSENIERSYSTSGSNEIDDNSLDYAIDLLPETEATSTEKQMLKGIRKFGNIEVRQIMRPRMDVSGIEYDSSFEAVLNTISKLHYSRLPVYKNNLDEPAGMLHTKDLIPFLDEAGNYDWHHIMREPFYVHEQKLIEDLMHEFLAKRIHFAIVVDEFGGTSGIVTLEDIMEEIIGEIKDEFDDEENQNKKIDDFNYIFEGKMMIGDACAAMQLPQDSFDAFRGDSDSVAGLVLELAGEFPEENTKFEMGDFVITPLAISKNRIEKVKITIPPKSSTE